MNTSRAQYRRAIPAADAITTSATLRSLTSTGAVVSGSGPRARRISSCARSAIGILRRNGEAGARLQRFVDGHRRFRTLRGGNDRKLHVARRVADDVEARKVRLAQIAGLHGAAAIHFTPEARGQVALLALTRREEDRLAAYRSAVSKGDASHGRTVMLHTADPRRVQLDLLGVELLAIVWANDACAVGAEDDPRCPRFQRQREPRTGRAASDDGDDLIAMLPSIAVRAVMHRGAIALLETGNVGHVIADARGNQRHVRADSLLVVEARFKEVAGMPQMRHRCAAWFDAIRAQLLASKA